MAEPNIPHLEFQDVTLDFIKEADLPCVSITIPCYLRRKFVPLMLTNIIGMDYPAHKIEVCILQDGPEDLFETPKHKEVFQTTIAPRTLKYVFEKDKRRTIGDKRNKLVRMAKHKIIASMDSDDIYFGSYLKISVNALKQYKAGITSSAAMLFTYPHDNFRMAGIRCGHKSQGHEACCVFTKKHFNSMGGFRSKGVEANQGEGGKMISGGENLMVNLDINKLMCCVGHIGEEGNSIDKEQFRTKTIEATIPRESSQIRVLESIFNVRKEDFVIVEK
jgi:glycosyltransferase involved in cell wall biosynthesis